MNDIVERLRVTADDTDAVENSSVAYLLEDAAAEIERLRKAPCPHVVGATTQYCSLTPFTLTDEEREAIGGMAAYFDTRGNITLQAWGSLLRVLLARLSPPAT
jgi:hypothetical protein